MKTHALFEPVRVVEPTSARRGGQYVVMIGRGRRTEVTAGAVGIPRATSYTGDWTDDGLGEEEVAQTVWGDHTERCLDTPEDEVGDHDLPGKPVVSD